MNVSCPDCHSVFRVDPAKVPSGGVRARCSVCGGVMPVDAGERAVAQRFSAESARQGVPQSPAVAPAVYAATPHDAAALHGTPGMFAAPAVATPAGGTLGAGTPGRGAPATPTPSSHPAASSPSPLVAPALGTTPVEPPRMVPPPFQLQAGTPPLAPSQPAQFGATPSSVAPMQATPAAPTRAAPTPAAPTPQVPTPTPVAPIQSGMLTSPGSAAAPRPPINPFLSNDPGQKARRLARALVSDMVTYHPTLRDQALREGTIKQLFKEEIKKSYEEYVEQVGHHFAESTSHFQDALNDILAGGRQVF